MTWFKKSLGRDKPASIEVETFTAYTITGLHPNLTEENWTNSQFDPLTDSEVSYIKEMAERLKGKVFLKNEGEHYQLIKGYHPSCDPGRPDLFLGRQLRSKALVGSISKLNGKVQSIQVPQADGSKREITSQPEIQKILLELGR